MCQELIALMVFDQGIEISREKLTPFQQQCRMPSHRTPGKPVQYSQRRMPIIESLESEVLPEMCVDSVL